MRSIATDTLLRVSSVVFLTALSYLVTPYAQAQSDSQALLPSAAMAFNTPEQAAEALIRAAESYDVSTLLAIFGPDGKDFVSSSDPVRDKSIAADFAAKAREKHLVSIDPKNKSQAILTVGNDGWPLPVPITKKGSKWYFDSKEGHDEILFRRIGANELDAIQICRGFVVAQKEYASEVHDYSGVNQYAQRIISTPGKHDGLYWQNADGTTGGPISEAIAALGRSAWESDCA